MNADQTAFVTRRQSGRAPFARPPSSSSRISRIRADLRSHRAFDPGQYLTTSLSIGYNSGSTLAGHAGQHHSAGVVKENDGYRRYDFNVNLDHR
jgi:hypothetical protein